MGQIIFSDSEITIYRKKVPPLILVGLSVIIGIAALIPIFATGFRIFYGMGFHFGLIISYLLFWGITIYIFRIILWNTNGKEILNFKQDKIIYYADYGLFKDGRKEIHTSELFFEFLEQPESHGKIGSFILYEGNNKIESVLNISRDEFEEIKKEIKTRYLTA